MAFEFKTPLDLEAMIDELENADIDVDYDRSATKCTFQLPGLSVDVVRDGQTVRFAHRNPQPPRELAGTFLKVRELSARQDLKMLPVI